MRDIFITKHYGTQARRKKRKENSKSFFKLRETSFDFYELVVRQERKKKKINLTAIRAGKKSNNKENLPFVMLITSVGSKKKQQLKADKTKATRKQRMRKKHKQKQERGQNNCYY